MLLDWDLVCAVWCVLSMSLVLKCCCGFLNLISAAVFRLPICHLTLLDGKTLDDVLQDGISFHAKELRGVKALVDGNLVIIIIIGSNLSAYKLF